MITNEELERRLGSLVDNTVSARTWTTVSLSPSICLEALASILRDLASELRSLYVDAIGSDPWADHPEEIQP